MRFTIVASVAFAVMANAIPLSDTANETSFLEARDSYDNEGSSMCSSLNVKYCDEAVNNKLIRNDDINYGAPGSGRSSTGACQAATAGFGCGVFIQGGSTCARSGNQMWEDYQDIRNYGAKTCGTKHWGDGCMTTINYVSGC